VAVVFRGDSLGSLPLRWPSGCRRGWGTGNQCADVYRVGRVLSSPRVCSPSLLMVELRVPVVAVLLLWQIRHLQAGVVFDEAVARFFCLLFFGSGSGAGDGDAVISSISGGGGRGFIFPLSCERVGFFDGFPVGDRDCAANVVGSGSLIRSSVVWTQPAAADLSSSLSLHKLAADGLSAFTMHLGGGAGRWLMQLLQGLTPLVKIGGGTWLDSGFRRQFGVRAASGSPCCLGVALCNFQIVQGAFYIVGKI
jgi:hypothetical protein